jgi:hypothetical protein
MNRFESVTKPLMWSTALLLVAFAAGCGGNDPVLGGGGIAGIPGAPADAILPGTACAAGVGPTIPTVTSSEPTHGNQVAPTSTTGVAGGGKLITATFSRAMDPATINATNFTLTPLGGAALVPASVSYNASTRVATLTTASALLAGTSYTAIVTQGATSATVPLACAYAFNFRTVTPAATGLAPVNLGLAAPFAIASAAGLTNTITAPLTQINGDVVLDPTTTCNAVQIDAAGGFGACAGSAPTKTGTVISPLFPDAGATSGAIKADLLAAYNSIIPANLPGATVLGCGTIGSGGGAGGLVGCAGNATLPPGVYISATASTIGVTGVLTLDGQGDANSRFVFQAPSALTTAAGAPGVPGSEIRLINGAKASNVWWQVGSSATIGTYALFRGNVLADTTITMGTGSTSCGRLLAGAVTASGQLVFDSNVVSVPGNASAPAGCQ